MANAQTRPTEQSAQESVPAHKEARERNKSDPASKESNLGEAGTGQGKGEHAAAQGKGEHEAGEGDESFEIYL